MIVDPARITKALATKGFHCSYICEDTWEIAYFRRRSTELFERIAIQQGWQRGGRRGELVGADVECAIVPGRTALKGMAEVSPLTGLGESAHGGMHKITSLDDARRWEDSLIAVAPQLAADFADDMGPNLLADTKRDRDDIHKYEELIGFSGEPNELIRDLRSRLSDRQRAEVERILKCWIVMIPDGRVFYELAALTIAACAAEVKGNSEWFFGIDPAHATDRSLMIELQLLASRFAHEPGWEDI